MQIKFFKGLRNCKHNNILKIVALTEQITTERPRPVIGDRRTKQKQNKLNKANINTKTERKKQLRMESLNICTGLNSLFRSIIVVLLLLLHNVV